MGCLSAASRMEVVSEIPWGWLPLFDHDWRHSDRGPCRASAHPLHRLAASITF